MALEMDDVEVDDGCVHTVATCASGSSVAEGVDAEEVVGTESVALATYHAG